jgi:Tfp pilus assembly protein FimT
MPRYRQERRQTAESPSYLRDKKVSGFSSFELVIVLAIILIVTVMSVPSLRKTLEAYRGSSAARGLAGQLSVSKMRAASDYTRTKLSIDTTNMTYVRSVYNKAMGTWDTEGGTQYLDKGVSFGYGSLTGAGPGGLASISQSTDIYFNSRGIPITAGGAAWGTYAIYLDNNAGRYYAITVNLTGQIRTWKYSAGAWVDE